MSTYPRKKELLTFTNGILNGETFYEFRFLSPAESPVENLDSSYLDSVSSANLKHTEAIYTFFLP